MKFEVFVFGRTLNIDFRDIFVPKSGISKLSEKLIIQLINTDTKSNGAIQGPRFLIAKESGQVIMGYGFNHVDYLEERLQTDGCRGLRSFVGIVIATEDFKKAKCLPTDINFYIDLYKGVIDQVWSLRDSLRNRTPVISSLYDVEAQDSWTEQRGTFTFNEDDSKCCVYTLSDCDDLLQSLKNCSTSLLTGLNHDGHILSAYRAQPMIGVKILNAVCLDAKERHEVTLASSDGCSVDPISHSGNRSKTHLGRNCVGGNGNLINKQSAHYATPTTQETVDNDCLKPFNWGDGDAATPKKVDSGSFVRHTDCPNGKGHARECLDAGDRPNVNQALSDGDNIEPDSLLVNKSEPHLVGENIDAGGNRTKQQVIYDTSLNNVDDDCLMSFNWGDDGAANSKKTFVKPSEQILGDSNLEEENGDEFSSKRKQPYLIREILDSIVKVIEWLLSLRKK